MPHHDLEHPTFRPRAELTLASAQTVFSPPEHVLRPKSSPPEPMLIICETVNGQMCLRVYQLI